MSICRSRKENDRAAQESPQDDELTYENKPEPSTPGYVLIDSRTMRIAPWMWSCRSDERDGQTAAWREHGRDGHLPGK